MTEIDNDAETVKQQMGVGIFSGDAENLDVDRAISELEKAGFRILRMPDRLIPTLAVPGDYFIEIYFECPDYEVDEIWERLRRIVGPYGGDVDSVGVVEEGHISFKECFGPDVWEH